MTTVQTPYRIEWRESARTSACHRAFHRQDKLLRRAPSAGTAQQDAAAATTILHWAVLARLPAGVRELVNCIETSCSARALDAARTVETCG